MNKNYFVMLILLLTVVMIFFTSLDFLKEKFPNEDNKNQNSTAN
jgi:hypothetical protein